MPVEKRIKLSDNCLADQTLFSESVSSTSRQITFLCIKTITGVIGELSGHKSQDSFAPHPDQLYHLDYDCAHGELLMLMWICGLGGVLNTVVCRSSLSITGYSLLKRFSIVTFLQYSGGTIICRHNSHSWNCYQRTR